jgi:hypothetical protein
MFANEILEERSLDGNLKVPITTLFIGSYDLAIEILVKLTKDRRDEAVATKFWRVQFDDPETKTEFLQIWSKTRSLDGWFVLEDCVAREWLIERGGVRLLEECVAITFSSWMLRAAFMAETDH